ncbi:MAG: cytidine deaminase [Clostridia bacterium]|nr:cytidine deaminase [Clostridia bacterium]
MKIIWQNDLAVEPSLLSRLQAAADCAAVTEGIERPCAVCVRLCDDEAIHALNRDYRGVDRVTDVLSFPLAEYPAGVTAGHADGIIRELYDDDAEACMLGDLVICVPQLYRQAEEYGHSPAREAAYLTVHGLCHLFGYDHIDPNDQREMRTMEEKILSAVGLSRDDHSPVSDETLLALAREAMERSYSPYSHFPVGAALLCEDGRVFQGCNIENASYGLGMCAERTAVFKAVSEGEHAFTAVAIASKGTVAWPCGACRQVLNEFAPHLRVLVTWDGHVEESTLDALLPHSFGPEKLIHE